MSEKKVSTSETACALGALEGLFLGMRALMALEVFQSSEGPTACCTAMRAGLVGLRGRDGGTRIRLAIGLLRVLLGSSWFC